MAPTGTATERNVITLTAIAAFSAHLFAVMFPTLVMGVFIASIGSRTIRKVRARWAVSG